MYSLSFDSFSNIDDIYKTPEDFEREFVKSFNKLFNSSKYNLLALNNQMGSLDNCINNITSLNNDNKKEENDIYETDKESQEVKLKKKEIQFLENIFPKEIEPPEEKMFKNRCEMPKYMQYIEIKLMNKKSRKNK